MIAKASRAPLLALLFLATTCASCGSCKKPANAELDARGGPETPDLPRKQASAAIYVDCNKPTHPIDDALFAVAFADEPADLHARGHRWGGNTTSVYNFKLGNAWNTGSDWFYRNVEVDSVSTFVDKARARTPFVAITVPMIGWASKDTTSGSFPVARFPNQQKTAPERPDLGNGLDQNGKPIAPGPPSIANVAITPDDVTQWIAKLISEGHGADEYILDNEPALWNSSHRDVHPEPETYDELLEKTLAYARAIRKAAPNAIIAGPAEWGWPGYFYSAKDAVSGFRNKPDRRAHGDLEKLVYYIQRLASEEKRTGEKLVDVIDLHFYPQAEGVQGPDGEGGDGGGKIDPKTNAARLRSTRALWDDTYKDESYIDEKIALIPRIQKIIAENNPRLGFQIGEFNMGGERDMSGALALAESLGRMAEYGVLHAFYWKSPKEKSPAYFALRAFTNYNDEGASFSGDFVATRSTVGVSAFAAKKNGKLTIELLQFDPNAPRDITIDVSTCGQFAEGMESYTLTGDGPPHEVATRGIVLRRTLPAHSLTTLSLYAHH